MQKIFCHLKKYSDEDGESGEEEGDWLVRHLAALPCFPLVYRNLAASLRRACQVETDPATVALYIRSVKDSFSQHQPFSAFILKHSMLNIINIAMLILSHNVIAFIPLRKPITSAF